jgi:hypothetical protein
LSCIENMASWPAALLIASTAAAAASAAPAVAGLSAVDVGDADIGLGSPSDVGSKARAFRVGGAAKA